MNKIFSKGWSELFPPIYFHPLNSSVRLDCHKKKSTVGWVRLIRERVMLLSWMLGFVMCVVFIFSSLCPKESHTSNVSVNYTTSKFVAVVACREEF
jgi:hypothetical protein